MKRIINAIEVFEMAEQIERNGVVFYRKAAERFENHKGGGIFTQLADWEIKHGALFAGMRKEMAGDGSASPSFNLHDEPLDIKAVAALAAFDFNPLLDPAGLFKGSVTQLEVLELALQMERNTITFYTALQKYLADEEIEEKLCHIIAEEKHHIHVVSEAIAEVE